MSNQPAIRSRRQLLGFGAVAATAAAGLDLLQASPAAAADGDPVLLARVNEANNPTVIQIVDSGQPGLRVISRTDEGTISAENTSSDGYAVNAVGTHIGVVAVGGDVGVYSVSDYGVGIRALTYDGVALEGSTAVDAGLALRVNGAAHFSRSGRATVAAGDRSVTVAAPVRGESTALATLQSRQAGVVIEAAVPDPVGRTLTIWLSRAPKVAVAVAWMLLD